MGTINGYWEKDQGAAPECDLVIHSCGHQILDVETETRRPNGRGDYQLIYVCKGRGYFGLNKELVLEAGCFILYPPYEAQYYSYDPRDHTEVYYIHFSQSGADALLQSAGFTSGHQYQIGTNDKFSVLFERIIHELQAKPPLYRQTAVALLLQWISYAARQIARSKHNITESTYECILNAVEYIHQHYRDSMSIGEYAQFCGLSKYYFEHCFRRIMNVSPIVYRNKIRIEKAKELLEEQGHSIYEIAERVGFEDASYFSKVFKRHEGVSPYFYHPHLPFS